MSRMLRLGLTFAVSATTLTAFCPVPSPATEPPAPPYLNAFPDFEPQLTPQQLPGDVDMALKRNLDDQKKFSLVQRLFDLWSWQAFVSLNWPTDAGGKRIVAPGGGSTEPPAWSLWTGSTRVFLPHGAKPPACGTGVALEASAASPEIVLARGLPPIR